MERHLGWTGCVFACLKKIHAALLLTLHGSSLLLDAVIGFWCAMVWSEVILFISGVGQLHETKFSEPWSTVIGEA